MSQFFSFLANPWVFMPIFFIILAIIILQWWFKFRKPVRNRTQIINELTENMGNNISANHFENLNELLEKDEYSFISMLWKKYKRNIFMIKDDDGIDYVYSTIDADEYFNLAEVGSDLSLTFWQNIAGILTGLGILGTFLGLTFGLSGIDMSSNAGIQKGISNLLGGTSTAFITSIFGIILALLVNWYYSSSLIKNFSASIENLADGIDELIPKKPAEALLYENATAVKDQTEELQDFNTQLAAAIGEALRNAMNTDVKPVLEELVKAIDNLSKGGVKSIADSINNNAGAELRSFAETLKNLQQGMQDILAQSQRVNEENNQKLREAVNDMVKSLQTATSASMADQKKNMDEMNSGMRDLFKELNDNLKDTVKNLLDAASRTSSDLGTNLSGAVKSTGTIIDNWESISKQQQEQLAHNIEQIRSILEKTLKAIQEDRESNLNALRSVTKKLQDTMNSSDVLIKQAGTTADQFANAAKPMNTVAQTMNSSVHEVIDATKSFNSQVGTTILALKETSATNVRSINTVRESLEKTEESWHAYEKVFQGLDEQLGKTFTELEENLVKYNQLTQRGLSDDLAEFDKSISMAIGKLYALVEELQEAVEDLNKKMLSNNRKESFPGKR